MNDQPTAPPPPQPPQPPSPAASPPPARRSASPSSTSAPGSRPAPPAPLTTEEEEAAAEAIQGTPALRGSWMGDTEQPDYGGLPAVPRPPRPPTPHPPLPGCHPRPRSQCSVAGGRRLTLSATRRRPPQTPRAAAAAAIPAEGRCAADPERRPSPHLPPASLRPLIGQTSALLARCTPPPEGPCRPPANRRQEQPRPTPFPPPPPPPGQRLATRTKALWLGSVVTWVDSRGQRFQIT